MIIVKVFLFLICFGISLKGSWRNIRINVLTFLSIYFLLGNLIEIRSIQTINAGFQILGLGLFTGSICKHFLTREISNLFRLSFLAILLIIIAHNFVDFISIPKSNNSELLAVINPWGLFWSFILIFGNNFMPNLSLNEKDDIFQYLLGLSFLLLVLIVITYLGFITGNTSKALDGGGVGIGRLSTNDTALISLCFGFIFLQHIKERKKLFYSVMALSCNIVIIFFTQSRLAILCVLIIFIFAIMQSSKLKTVLKYSPLILFLTYLLFVVFKSRFEADVDPRIPDEIYWAHFGSGRLIIWAEYLLSFINDFGHSIVNIIFGIGYWNIGNLYSQSNLFVGGWVLEDTYFYPIHNDLLLLFFSGGGISIILYFTLVYISKNKQSIVNIGMILLLTVYVFFDMLNYSIFSSFIIGIGLNWTKYPKSHYVLKDKK